MNIRNGTSNKKRRVRNGTSNTKSSIRNGTSNYVTSIRNGTHNKKTSIRNGASIYNKKRSTRNRTSAVLRTRALRKGRLRVTGKLVERTHSRARIRNPSWKSFPVPYTTCPVLLYLAPKTAININTYLVVKIARVPFRA